MTLTDQHVAVLTWTEPEGIACRGTLVVIPGRGEQPAHYERFGRRIAADGYRVHAVAEPTADPALTVSQVSGQLADQGTADPRVLAGSDTGARYAAAAAAELVSISGGRHDVLNDVTHRTVAATIVLFLERLRLGAELPRIAIREVADCRQVGAGSSPRG